MTNIHKTNKRKKEKEKEFSIKQLQLRKIKQTKMAEVTQTYKYCLPLEKIGLDDIPKAGGKTASLGEMIQHLTSGNMGVKVPGGYAILSNAYDAVLEQCCLRERLKLLLDDVDGEFNLY
jgi:pyruvate,water dikinase